MVEVPTPLLLLSSSSLWSPPALGLEDAEELVADEAGTVTITVTDCPSSLTETEFDVINEVDVGFAGGALPLLAGLEGPDGGADDVPLEEVGGGVLAFDVAEGWVGEGDCAGEGELELEGTAEDDVGAALDEDCPAELAAAPPLELPPPLALLLSPPGPGSSIRSRCAIWCDCGAPRRS